MRSAPHPDPADRPLKAYPGSDGQTTWNAGPCSGSVSRLMTSRNSKHVLGHPWVSRSGVASRRDAGAWIAWMSRPSMCDIIWGNVVMREIAVPVVVVSPTIDEPLHDLESYPLRVIAGRLRLRPP